MSWVEVMVLTLPQGLANDAGCRNDGRDNRNRSRSL